MSNDEHGARRYRLTYVWAAVAWLCAVIVTFAGQFAAQAAWTGGDSYSWAGNDISDLGMARCGHHSSGGRLVCSPHHVLANSGFAIYGVLILIGLRLVVPLWRRTIAGTVAAILLMLAAIGSIVVGAAPSDLHSTTHQAAAGIVFICGNLAMIAAAFALRRCDAHRLAWFSAVLGVIGLIGVPIFLSHHHLGLGRGGIERIVVWSLDLWNVVIAVALLHSSRTASSRDDEVDAQQTL